MKPDAKCLVCEKGLYKAPTKEGWIRVRYAEGVCWDCVESLHGHVEAVKRAQEQGTTKRLEGAMKPYVRSFDSGDELREALPALKPGTVILYHGIRHEVFDAGPEQGHRVRALQ